jgi:hypothetical protein
MIVYFQNMNDDQDGCLPDASNLSQPLTEHMKRLQLDDRTTILLKAGKKEGKSTPSSDLRSH